VTDLHARAGPTPASPVVAGLRWACAVLLLCSVGARPLVAAEHDFARLLVLTLGMTGALFWALQLVFDGQLVIPTGWGLLGGVLALAAAGASAAFADSPHDAILTLVKWLGYGAVFLLALWLGRDRHIRHLAVAAVCAVAVCIALYAVLQYGVLLGKIEDTVASGELDEYIQSHFSAEDLPAFHGRVRSRRVYGSFFLPNTLAAFLALAFGPVVALLFTTRRRGLRWVLLPSALVIGAAFVLTFSKAGWLAAAAVLIGFLVVKARHRLRRRWLAVLAAAALLVAALAAGVSWSPRVREAMSSAGARLGASADVRLGYWDAALSMWRAHPTLGVGPGSFNNHYMRHKALLAGETKNVHNDYLQLLAECGLVAPVGYVLFWLWLLVGSFRPRAGPAAAPLAAAPRRLIWVLGAAGVGGFVAAAAIGRPLAVSPLAADAPFNLAFHALLAVLWCGAFAAFAGASADEAAASRVRVGLALGLLVFVLHSSADLHLYVEGVTYVAFALAGLTASSWVAIRRASVGRWRVPVLAGVSVAGLALLFVTSRLCEADAARVYGGGLVRSGSPRAGEILETAARANPLDHRTFATLAEHHERAFAHTRNPADVEAALAAWTRAIALNPTFPEYHARLSRWFRKAAQVHPVSVRDRLDTYRARFAELENPPPSPPLAVLLPAVVEGRLGVTLSPTTPQYRIVYGDALWQARLRSEARTQYEKALELHQSLVEGKAPHRQHLTSEQLRGLKARPGLTPSGGGAIIPK